VDIVVYRSACTWYHAGAVLVEFPAIALLVWADEALWVGVVEAELQ